MVQKIRLFKFVLCTASVLSLSAHCCYSFDDGSEEKLFSSPKLSLSKEEKTSKKPVSLSAVSSSDINKLIELMQKFSVTDTPKKDGKLKQSSQSTQEKPLSNSPDEKIEKVKPITTSMTNKEKKPSKEKIAVFSFDDISDKKKPSESTKENFSFDFKISGDEEPSFDFGQDEKLNTSRYDPFGSGSNEGFSFDDDFSNARKPTEKKEKSGLSEVIDKELIVRAYNQFALCYPKISEELLKVFEQIPNSDILNPSHLELWAKKIVEVSSLKLRKVLFSSLSISHFNNEEKTQLLTKVIKAMFIDGGLDEDEGVSQEKDTITSTNSLSENPPFDFRLNEGFFDFWQDEEVSFNAPSDSDQSNKLNNSSLDPFGFGSNEAVSFEEPKEEESVAPRVYSSSIRSGHTSLQPVRSGQQDTFAQRHNRARNYLRKVHNSGQTYEKIAQTLGVAKKTLYGFLSGNTYQSPTIVRAFNTYRQNGGTFSQNSNSSGRGRIYYGKKSGSSYSRRGGASYGGNKAGRSYGGGWGSRR